MLFPAWTALLLVVVLTGRAGFAAEPSAAEATRVGLLAVEVAEEVRQAPPGDRARVAVSALERLAKPPGSNLVAAVAAVVEVDPALAPVVVAHGVSLQKSNAVAVAVAAARKAPGYAARIVAAACTNAPAQFDRIAIQVDRAAPGADHSIVLALGQAIPGLSPYLERAKTLVQQGARYRPSVAVLLNETVEMIEAEGHGEAGRVIEGFLAP